ncbi:MAG TPA: TlpA disulfide reductase family protein [Methylomirabilota bacterium]|jgi:peroxiredoxin
MSRVPISLALATVLITVATGVAYLALRWEPGDETATPIAAQPPRAEPTAPSASAPPPADTPSPRPAKPRPGRQLALDAAMRELDLIQPSRTRAVQDFTLPLVGGKSFRLTGHRGQILLINFWATWCPPCLEEMPALERLWRQHRDHGFVLLAVSLDTDSGLVGPFLARHRLTFPVALDPKYEVANLYGVRALPATFVVDRLGNLAALALGPRTWDNDAAHSLVEALAK